MDCSDGAKMLIDQMKAHPEEFRGYGGKFSNLLDTASDAIQGTLRNIWMSKRDATAILAAAETHLYEVWLAEDVLTRIMQPKLKEPEEPKYKVGLTPAHIANTALNSIHNNIGPSYEEYVRRQHMEKEKHRMELDQLRRQDIEHALRNTKPFKNYL
jgi:hypothetical protein